MNVKRFKDSLGEYFSPLTDFGAITELPPILSSSQFIRDWSYLGNAIELPFSINAVDGQSSSYAQGTFNLESSFVIHKLQPVHLWFAQASQSAEIYVNDVKVTTHWGGYNSFFVDVSEYVRKGTNTLKVALTNTTRGTLAPDNADFNFNATLGEVRLLTSPVLPAISYGYDGFHVSSTVTDSHAHIEVRTAVPAFAEIVCRIEDEDFQYVSTKFGTGEFLFEAEVDDPHLWNGTIDPHLYRISLSISHNGDVYHQLSTSYGLRYFSASSSGFLLNGEPYLLRGVCYHQDKKERANALTSEDIDNDFKIIAELGCNFMRCAHYPHPKQVYDYCDRLGIIVQTEVPWINKCQTTQPEDYWTHLIGQYIDMVNAHYNHPSIVFWGLGNEVSNISTFSPALAKEKNEEYYALIKSMDSSRLVGYVTLYLSGNLTNPKTGYNSPEVDWYGTNLYVGWYYNINSNNPTSQINACQEDVGSSPFAVSEYGGGGTQRCHSDTPISTTNKGNYKNGARHDIEYQMLLHEGHLAAIRNKPELLFTSLWIMFDFAVADRTEGYTVCLDGTTTTTDNNLKYINDKGIVERDHKTKKDTFYLYKAEWSREKFVHICGKSYTKTSDRVIKCYSNDGTSFSLYVNDSLVETVNSQNNILSFSSRTFTAGDTIRVEGATTSDTFVIADNNI